MEPSPFRTMITALLAAAATGAAIPAYASAFTVTSATSGQTTTFTVTRSGDTSVAETVAYRAVSRSALAGLHFRETAGSLAFAAGQTSLQVFVEERTAAQIDDPRFTYFQSGGATGASRAYRFEVVDEGGFPVAAADRSIDYGSSNSVSSAAFAANALAVSSGEITVTDGGYAQAYHAVPLSSYFSSAVPQNYLAASGARIRMTLDFQAKELSDGYQYVQILADQTSACDSGAGDGDPGTLRASSYLAGFELWKGNTLAEYATLSFPVTSAGNNCGAVSTPWKDTGHNDLGNLCQQRFAANCRAADGRLSLPASLSTLGVRFDASGSGNDDWVAKSVVARLQAVPAGPSLLASRPVVTPAPVCKGATVAVSLVFGEIVTVSSPSSLALSTSWGDLPYAAGSGANVLTFAGPVTAAAGTPLRVTGLSGGTVQGLAGDAFAWPGNLAADRTVDSLPTPPLEAATGFYLLSTPAHLRWLSERIASYPATSAALADDIDLSAAGSFPAMGGSAGFAGVFDGRGHALAGLSVTAPDSSGASPARYGLFGLVAAQGVVSNLMLSGATVSASGNPALVGAVCGRNLGTIDHCSVSGGQVSTAPRDADGTGTALGGVCGENAGTIRACRAVAPLASGSSLLFNRVSNDAVGGIAGVNAASGTLEACYFHAWFDNVSNVNITRGAICGSNAGTVRRCGGLHDNRNYFDGAVGSGAGTVEDTSFPAASAFSGGEVCYALNGGVTDGSQPWYQSLDPLDLLGDGDPLPVFAGPTVYLHGSTYVNRIYHDWVITSDEPSADYSNFVWTVTCSFGETATLSATGTAEVTRQPTCTEPGKTTWTYVPPANDYGITGAAHVDQPAPAVLGHDWGEPEYRWYSSAQVLFCHAFRTCARCDATTNETVAATLVSSLAPTCTAPGTNTCAAAFASPLFAPQTNAFEVAALGHAWGEATYVWAVDHSSVTASNACTRCGQTVQETAATTISATTAPTCTEPGTMTLAADFSSPAFSPQSKTIEADPALGHDWGAPVWNWNADYTAATATFACSRCDEAETVAAAVAHAPGEGDATNCTATVVHHGETFTDTVVLRPPVTYIDADGVERQCIRYTVLLYDNGWYSYGEEGAENWYVVSSNVTSGLPFNFHDAHAHLILCDGATLTASNPGGYFAICADGSLTIYGQSGGTGAIFASADIHAIVADDNITLNGGIVEATTPDPDVYDGIRAGIATINGGVVRGSICGGYGVTVNGGVVESSRLSTFNSYDIVLGWTNATDSITAAAYSARSVSVRAGQRFWNGEEFVGDGELAGRTLTPAYEITYALNGGSVEGENPAFYARESEEIVLANPVRVGYDFAGWIGTGLAAPTNRVVIPRGSVGHRAYAATWERITAVPYIDENGDPQVCTDFICLSGASGNVVAGASGPTNWYVVSGRVAIGGHLLFQEERSCIILRDGATLAVTNATDTVDDAIRAEGRLEIYGQAGGTGAIAARGNLVSNDDDGIQAASLAIYGGSVRAVGAYGIYVTGDLVMGGGTVVARAENGNGIQADGLLVRGGAIDSVGSSRGIYVKKDGMTVLGGTVSAVCSSLWTTGIYVANGDIAVRGGRVVAAGNKSAAIYVRNGGFAMSGGAVTATSADATDAIYASGDIVLGWTDLADFILAGRYTSASGAVSVQKGQTFADEGGNLYEGELDSGELAAARGKTLRPYIASYAAWAAASGVSGAWNETDALGIHNVFRYAFDKPAGAFTNPPLLGIAFASDGTALVLTPPLVNTVGFDFSLLATDDLAGANPATFPLDPSGTNAVPATSSPRFFRLRAAER